MSSSARTWFVVGLLVVIGTIVTLGVVNRSSPVDPDEFRELVVRADGTAIPGVLVSSEPCETDGRSDDCLDVTHPVTRPLGGGAPQGAALRVRPGQRIEVDAAGRAADLSAYVGRYARPSDGPIADGDDAAADFERVDAGPVEETPRRWYVDIPEAGIGGDEALLLLRFEHARAVKTPFPTADGPPGSDELAFAWWEIPLESASAP